MQLLMEGGLKGKQLSFPFTLQVVDGFSYKNVTIESLDKLIELIHSEELANKDGKKNLKSIIEDIGLYDTKTLMDSRTANIISNFSYYRSNATPSAPFDNIVWFESIQILESLTQQRMI